MTSLLYSMMALWPVLLNSLLPLLLAFTSLSASAYLLVFPRREGATRLPVGFSRLLLGNLLAAVSWGLIYADQLTPEAHPEWPASAPAAALACLVLLPLLSGRLCLRLRRPALDGSEKLVLGLSLLFQGLSLFPGLYALTLYLLVGAV